MAALTRRSFAAGATGMLCSAIASAEAASGNGIAAIEHRRGGRLGVFVVDTGTGRVLAHRADERFLLCSTFKGVLAALTLSRVDAGLDALDALVPYGASDLVGVAPVTRARLREGALSVQALCAAILTYSDNTAANLLLARAGGPAALTLYARGLGDPVTRFDRYELAASRRDGQLDTTSPRAIAGTARTLVLGDALQPGSRARLERWMRTTVAGRTRLRASFPRDWAVADRTGTGDGECNDYAIARRPGQGPLAMAVYYDAPAMTTERQEAVLREVGTAIVQWAGER